MKAIIITLIYLSGLYSIGFDFNGAFKAQDCYWQEKIQEVTGLPVRVVRTIKRKDFDTKLINLQSWQQKFFRVKAWVARRKYQGIKLVYAPPLLNDKTIYFAGMGDVCKPLDGTAMVYGAEKNQDGVSRLYNIQVTAAHELGHVALGARHDDTIYPDGASIMHSLAAHPEFIHPRMRYSEKSKAEMRKCLGVR